MACTLVVASVVVWLFTTIDLPDDPVRPQASVLFYADAWTVLARIGVTDRTDVRLDRVPEQVRHAVLAAEDRDFYDHAGVSVRGVLRAVWANATAGGAQGASTITQQYVRNAYLTLDQTVGRKVREMVLAVKLEHREDKDTILEHYLNTIYFGRGAYGIEAAARAYFGVGVDRLTVEQGAVLAAVIKDPTQLDPANDPEAARDRWRWIIDSMVDSGWLDHDAGAAARYPTALPSAADGSGPDGHIIDRVERELRSWGVTAQALRTAGLSVVTTLDVATQRAVVESARAVRGEFRAAPRVAVVAVEPSTGAVRGYYGGERGRGFYDDAMAPRPPGRLFQPVVLAEALSQGYTVDSRWDGRSPRTFADRGGVPLYNQDNAQCPSCRLDEALWLGLNTPYYAAAERIGPARVARRAQLAGISASYGDGPSLVDVKGEPKPGRTRADVSLGHYPVSVADLASVYATFAATGRRVERHLVTAVRAPGSGLLSHAAPRSWRAMTPSVAADVSFVLSLTMIAAPSPRPPDPVAFDRFKSVRTAAIDAAVPRGDRGVAGLWCARYVAGLAVVGWVGHDPARGLVGSTNHTATASAANGLCAAPLDAVS